MTKEIRLLRPTVPAGTVSAQPVRRPGLVPDGTVSVEWDQGRGLYLAACDQCSETFTAERLDQAHTWAEDHRCDPELVALLDQITRRAA